MPVPTLMLGSLRIGREMPGALSEPAAPAAVTPEAWKRLKAVLAEAQDLAEDDLERYLSEACGDDEALRSEALSLLAAANVPVALLDRNPIQPGDGLSDADAKDWLSGFVEGRRVGPYRIERRLAVGGMGIVVLAVRETDFRQRVALKFIKPTELSDDLDHRFRRERQILADLEHPNIAAIYDAGTTTEGVSYFAMEYVEGKRIDRYCDARQLPIRGRLELFLRVCSAVRAAHQSLVVHRDLKPENILVTEAGVPKLIDFGIAKWLKAERCRDNATRIGACPMTAWYASPEQVRGEPITVSSDIYALGVLLFELLTGAHPYRPNPPSEPDPAWIVCNVDPPRPSSTVRPRTGTKETVAEPGSRERPGSLVSSACRDDWRSRRRGLAGDLDSIVLRAMRKNPRERYGSVEQLSADIRRHLAGWPVTARDGTFLYRAGKRLRRDWRSLSTGVAMLLMVGGTIYYRVQTSREMDRLEVIAVSSEQDTEAVSELMQDLLIDAFRLEDLHTRASTVLEILMRAEEQISLGLRNDPERLATQKDALAKIYTDLGYFDRSGVLLEDALDLRRRFFGGDHRFVAKSLNMLGAYHYRIGDYARSEVYYRQAIRMKERLHQRDVDLTMMIANMGTIMVHRAEYGEAEELYRRVLQIRTETSGPESAEVARSLLDLGGLFYIQGQFERAESSLRRALAIWIAALGPSHENVVHAKSSLGKALQAQGKLGEAEALLGSVLEYREARLGRDHVYTARTRKDLAEVRLDSGEPVIAARLVTDALSVLRESRPDDSWEIAAAESLLGACWATLKRYDEAEPLLERSYLSLKQTRGERTIYTRNALRRLQELDRARKTGSSFQDD